MLHSCLPSALRPTTAASYASISPSPVCQSMDTVEVGRCLFDVCVHVEVSEEGANSLGAAVDHRERSPALIEIIGLPYEILTDPAETNKVARKRAQTPPALLHRGWRFSMSRPPGSERL